MSYQPQQPMGGPPPPQGQYPPAPQYAPQYPPQPPVPPAPASPKSGRSAVRVLGIVLLVLGVGGGAALFLLAGSTREETIARFARAPAGCTTTLEFDKVGTYDVYIELTGTVGAVGGDCAGNGQSYQWAGTTLPAYALTMVDGDGQSVVLAPSTAHSYDTGTWRGQTVNQVQITTPGSYRLTVDSTDSGYAVAIGGDPDADASTQQMAGIGATGAGLVLGLLLIVFGRRKGGATSGGAPVSVPQYAPAQYATGQYPTAPAAPAPPPPPGWGAPQQ